MKVLSKAGSRKRPAPSEADAPDSQSSTQEMLQYLIILSNQQEVQQALQTSNFEVGEEQLPSLEARRDEIITVLDEIGVGAKIKQAKHVDEKIETHRDFLLKEMAWLANDFQEERKRHATRGKKISKMVLQHHKQLGNKDKKEAKEQEVQLRRVAMKSAREIKKFWLRINQVVTFKQKIEADEARQKAMDKHLGYLVKQTERYTSLLAEHMRGGGVLDDSDNESQTNISDAPKQTSSTRPLSKRQRSEIDETETMSSHPSDVGLEAGSSDADQEDDDEFIGESEQDDETTLAQAEMELAEPYDEELAALEQEKEMSVEQLQQMYGGVFGQPLDDDDEEQPSVDGSVHNSNDEEVDGEPLSDGDYEGPSEEDDETTLIQAEKEEENESYKDELLGLDKDNEISVEELRAKYGGIFGQTQESDDDNGNQSTSDNNDDNDDNNPDERSSLVASSGTDDADFHATSEEDDETTLIEAENEHNESYRDEIEDLEKDQEIAVEILRAKYASLFGQPQESDDSDHDGNDQSAQNNLDDNDDNDDGNNNHAAADDRSSLVASSGSDDDDDFHVASEEDDETTLIEAEREVPEAYDEEIAALKQESEMSVSELRAKYAAVFGHASDTEDDNQASSSHDVVEAGEEPVETNNEEDEGDGEFLGESEEDDESTLIQAEQEDTGVDYSAEIQLLQDEKDVPIEELRRRYANLDAVDAEDSEDIEDDIQPSEANGEIPMETVTEPNETEKGGDDVGLALKRLQAADEAARAIQVERPYLLSPKLRLREYQQVGLNWLVSLHDRRLNGILADEMGLGKTIQTIALLAYLACYKGIWGPHLIVVPTSVLLNWESELKRWCPIFKVLTYYGSAKQRKVLRQGWSKLNTFHICITSYQLVVQDSMMFRRKRWYYMVLDEAHNIKNFKSQRWQTLLHFNTHRRLLLTGTPLQNNLMELWSLMHFLMPHLFRSRKEFSYWFSNPLTHMVEGNRGLNNDLIGRLHTIMRPFILRRLKKDVEKQLPGKYEHIVRCSLSKRQQFLYEEFMARTTTRSALAGANFMGMMNILMQLRKVCNHPDLFEPRPIVSPFQMVPSLSYNPSSIVVRATNKSPLDCVSSNLLQFWCVDMDGHVRDRIGQLQTPREWLVMMDDVSMPSPKSVVEPALRQELGAFYQKLYMRAQARKLFNAMLNAKRCNCIALPFSWRLMNAVTLPPTPLDLASSNTNQCVQPMECSSVLKSLILTADQRATQMEDIIEQYVFVIPKATSLGVQLTVPRPDPNTSVSYARFQDKFLPEFKKVLSPFYRSAIRQRMFFPDRKLVQFDSGKLQTLNVLLRRLKKEGHKCLIFTQMSRMLDILEAFLNLHGHTYVRLDGSTGVEKRQKLMDRFNADPKLFCFILSTRSGGLGINLTGADTVIFYDSDWNPAMDAQAQDRAHRIGQTRDVHIYRLVCGSTVEENILIKAKQKRHLDFLVMTEGNFTAESFYDQNSLKELLNTELTPVDLVEEAKSNQASQPQQQLPQDTEAVMLALEDEDDIVALKGAQKEVVDEMREFDENAPIPTDESSEQKPADAEIKAAAEEAINEQEVEAEFNAWQTSVGPDFKALEASLRPFEKYAVRFKTVQDPFYSLYYLTDQQKRAELEVAESTTEWDVEEIEREKENEEARAFAEGELLAAKVTKKNIERQKQLYHKQRSQAMAAKKRRKLTGEAWTLYNDGPTGIPFWYNEDTGEARYGKPPVIAEKERYQSALERGYTRIPVDLLQRVYEFLTPYPDRCACMVTCARWNEAGKDEDKFYKRVLPVESGAREKLGGVRLSPNDYVSIEAAIATALPGDTILLDPGHHWETTLRISKPLRFIGDVTEPSRVVIELRDGVHVEPEARLTLCGISIRRPAKMLDKGPAIECCNATVQLCSCIVNNDGGGGAGIRMVNSNLMLFDSTVQGALQSAISIIGGSLLASRCSIVDNAGNGVTCLDGTIGLEDTYVNNNGKYAVAAYGQSIVWFEHCEITNNQSKTVSFDLDEDVVAFQRKVIFDQRDRKAVEKFVALRETNGEGDDDDGAEVYSVPRVSKEKVELANNVVIPLPLPPSNPPPITKPVATPAPTSVAPIKHEISVSPQMLQSPQPKRQRLPSSEVIPTQGTPVVVESSIAPVASPVTTTFFPSQQLSPPQAAPQYHSAVHHHELNGSYGAYPMMPSAESMHPTPQMLQYSNPTMDYINSYQQRLQQLQLQTRELAIRQQQQQMAYSTMPQHYMMPTTAQYYASAYPQQQPQQHYAVDRNGHPIVYSYNGSSSQQQQQQQYYSHHQSSSSSSSSQNRYSGL